MGKFGGNFWLVLVIGILCGCDPLTTYKVTSTIFDGVPRMPPPEQYCREYHERALSEEREAEQKKKRLSEQAGIKSVHPPYAEKRCNDCHDKNTDSGFVAPTKELCFVCHPDFLKGSFSHGPAAVGDCLKCHLPHDSPNPKLVKLKNGEMCALCHREKRLSEGLHAKSISRGMSCTECHNPHGGNNQFFLE
jgi:predicted CXXCH cytochrome family protein